MTTTNKLMTGEQLDELMTVAVNMQRDSEKVGERPAAMFAYAVQVAVLELRKVRDDAAALAVENAGLKESTPELQTMMTALDAFFADEEVPERAMLGAYNILRNAVKTPATDSFLAKVRAQGVEMFAEQQRSLIGKPSKNDAASSYSSREAISFAAQLRKGAAQ